MQICIGPKGWGVDANLLTRAAPNTYAIWHRYQGLGGGGSTQICIRPNILGGPMQTCIDPSYPLGPMQICIGIRGLGLIQI